MKKDYERVLSIQASGGKERGLAREEGTQDFPSPTTSPSNGHPAGNGGARANGGPPRGVYVGFASPLMARLEAYERRVGKTFPRDKRGGWLLAPEQWAAVEGGS